MVDYSKLPQQQILCIDMKSFYASCSAVMEVLFLRPPQISKSILGLKQAHVSLTSLMIQGFTLWNPKWLPISEFPRRLSVFLTDMYPRQRFMYTVLMKVF